MMVEKPKRDEWKTLVIALPLLLAIVGVLMYAEMTAPPVAEVVEPASTVPEAQEEGEDVSKLAVGNYLTGDSWWGMDVTWWYANNYTFPDGVPNVSYGDFPTGIPTPEDPSSPQLILPARLYDAYITYDADTKVPVNGYAYVNVVNADQPSKMVMHVYTLGGTLVASSDNWTVEVGEGWHEFTFVITEALVDDVEYLVAVGSNAVDDVVQLHCTTDFAKYDPPPPPGPGGAVLPLIKTESDMAEGTLIN